MNRPHRNWHANHPAKTPGPCPGDRSRVPHACSGVRPASINALAPRVPTWPALYIPGSIAASLALETRRRSPSVENPLLPARAEGTSPWINPCTFHERRTCLPSSTFHTVHAVRPLRTWPSLVFTRLRQRVRGEHRYVSDIEEI